MAGEESFNEQRESLTRELLDRATTPDHCLGCPTLYLKASAYARIAITECEGLTYLVQEEFEADMSKCVSDGTIDNKCYYPRP